MDPFQGVALTLFLQNHFSWLTVPMQAASVFGMAEIYFLIIPAICWCYDMRLGLRLALLTSMCAWVNDILKQLFHLPRPYYLSRNVAMLDLGESLTFGFPSGHSQIPIAFLGLIGYWLKKPFVWLAIGIILITIGVSRLYLGVHFSLDVLGGWLIGLMILISVILLDKPVSHLAQQLSDRSIILIAFIISCSMSGLQYLIASMYSGFQIPDSWYGIDPGTLLTHTLFAAQTSLLTAGFFFGTIVGWTLSRNHSPFHPNGSLTIRVTRFALGMVVLAGIWILMGVCIHAQPDPENSFLYWVRGALLGVWILYGAPLLFKKTGLVSEP